MCWKRHWLCIVAALLLVSSVCVQDSIGADKIRVLLTGRVSRNFLIATWFMTEPMVDPLFVPSRALPLSQIRKYVRIYFPRTYRDVRKQDFFIFAGTIMNMFSPKQQKWMRDAIHDGSGGLNSRSMLSGIYYPEWANSFTQQAFPNDVDALMRVGKIYRSGQDVTIILEDRPDLPPVLTMFKDKKIQWHLTDYSCALVIPRPGATVWSWIKGPFADYATVKPGCTPHVISWRYGNGTTWTTHDRLVNWWEDPVANPYGMDMIMNMILYSTGRRLPDDIDVVHEIRSKISEYRTREMLLMATVEFAESFGANMNPILRRLGEITDERKEAEELYLEQEYLGARDRYDAIIGEIQQLSADAIRRKDRAMVWVHVIQWLTVSGTSMFAGFVLWTLMIRRRLYRQVGTTRFAGLR